MVAILSRPQCVNDITPAFLAVNHPNDGTLLIAPLGTNLRERERLSLSAFLGTEDIGVHIVQISHLIITYTLE